jgi:hypothetical protein
MYYFFNKINSNGRLNFSFCLSKYFWLVFLTLIFVFYFFMQPNKNILKYDQQIKTKKINNYNNNASQNNEKANNQKTEQNIDFCIKNEINKFVFMCKHEI